MKTSLFVFSLVAILAVLLHGVVSLPPDFFRNGRGIHNLPPIQKKSTNDLELVSVACEICGRYSPVFEYECKRGLGERRKQCVLGFLADLQSMASAKGWQDDEQ